MRRTLVLVLALLGAACDDEKAETSCEGCLLPGSDDRAALQEALIAVAPGGTVLLGEGVFEIDGELSLRTTANVTVKGQGTGTILDFSGQTSGANGIAVDGADGVTFEDLALRNSPGDGIRVDGTTGVTFRKVKVSWDGGSSASNGAYALYPVQSSKILIEDCEISGASDAGIYVGQSSQAVVRNNEVHGNVAGIEIENTTDAEVSGNHCTDNTAGILVFNLPELPVKDGKRCLIHDNEVVANNHVNFAAAGNIVASVPSGTGVLVLAADRIDVRNNRIEGNDSAGVLVAAFSTVAAISGRTWNDEAYDAFAEAVFIHDNQMTGNGTMPRDALRDLGGADVLWDGVVDPQKPNEDGALSLCARANGATTTFLKLGIFIGGDNVTDAAVVDCTHDPVPPVPL